MFGRVEAPRLERSGSRAGSCSSQRGTCSCSPQRPALVLRFGFDLGWWPVGVFVGVPIRWLAARRQWRRRRWGVENSASPSRMSSSRGTPPKRCSSKPNSSGHRKALRASARTGDRAGSDQGRILGHPADRSCRGDGRARPGAVRRRNRSSAGALNEGVWLARSAGRRRVRTQPKKPSGSSVLGPTWALSQHVHRSGPPSIHRESLLPLAGCESISAPEILRHHQALASDQFDPRVVLREPAGCGLEFVDRADGVPLLRERGDDRLDLGAGVARRRPRFGNRSSWSFAIE